MKSLLLLVLSMYVFSLSGQRISESGSKSLNETLYRIPLGDLLDFANQNGTKYARADGFPYLNDQFLPVKIDKTKNTSFIRLNIVDELVEVQEGTKVFLLDLSMVRKIKYLDGSNKLYEIKKYSSDGINSEILFLEAIKATDNHTLYRKEQKKFIPSQKKTDYRREAPAKFIEIEKLFYVIDFTSKTEQVLQIPKKKKKFMAFFDQKAKAVEKYIKQEKLDFKQSKDLIKILDFIFDKPK